MFCNLQDAALRHFDQIGVQVRYPARVPIFREGETARTIHVLCTGHVKLFTSSREGKTMILKIAWPGDVLGLGALLRQEKYELTAETLEPCQVKTLRRDEFLDFIDRYSEAGRHSLESMADEYQSAFQDARRLALSGTAAAKLAALLLEFGQRAACAQPEMRFTLALTHEELGNLAGVSRETITRLLSRFREEGFIHIKGTSVTITNPARFLELSGA
ncbi:MAG TPA: Crp/Fnr family transcriptional regulator [Alloacidobacterium sp.]|nr:Crp/Fnr family transcriptional regulator [Alloacidobacterium sp.]